MATRDRDWGRIDAWLGLLSLELNDIPAAIRWLQRALASDPDNGRWLGGLAEAEFAGGQLTAAQVTLVKALDIDPQHNPFPAKWRPGFIPLEAAQAFEKCGLIWRGANGDVDCMHFQAAAR